MKCAEVRERRDVAVAVVIGGGWHQSHRRAVHNGLASSSRDDDASWTTIGSLTELPCRLQRANSCSHVDRLDRVLRRAGPAGVTSQSRTPLYTASMISSQRGGALPDANASLRRQNMSPTCTTTKYRKNRDRKPPPRYQVIQQNSCNWLPSHKFGPFLITLQNLVAVTPSPASSPSRAFHRTCLFLDGH